MNLYTKYVFRSVLFWLTCVTLSLPVDAVKQKIVEEEKKEWHTVPGQNQDSQTESHREKDLLESALGTAELDAQSALLAEEKVVFEEKVRGQKMIEAQITK